MAANAVTTSWIATIWIHSESFSKSDILFLRNAVSPHIPKDALLTARSTNPSGSGEPLVFRAVDLDRDSKHRSSGLQLSVSQAVAAIFQFQNRETVVIAMAEDAAHTASHVELTYRDVLLDRSDMLRLSSQMLNDNVVHQGQTVPFASGAITFTVQSIYVRGQRARSALFGASTKPVFRSETARFMILIQLSKEMWDFDPEGSGDTLWTKCIDGFLVDLFQRWSQLRARHLVTIALFTRVWYKPEESEIPSKDFYKVIASEVPSTDATTLLNRMRHESRNFLRTVHVRPSPHGNFDVIQGILSTASQSCLLEAIHLATSHFSKACTDPDLLRTEKALLIVTPSAGLFEAEDNLLKLTTERVVSSGLGIDMVCLAHQPLHAVPLFAIRPARSSSAKRPAHGLAAMAPSIQRDDVGIDLLKQYTGWEFVKPSWMGAAFYQSHSRRFSLQARRVRLAYTPATRIYQVQSAGNSGNARFLGVAVRFEKNTHNGGVSSTEVDALEDEDESYYRKGAPKSTNAKALALPEAKSPVPTLKVDRVRPSNPQRTSHTSKPTSITDAFDSSDLTGARNSSPAPSTARLITPKSSFNFHRLTSGIGKSTASTGASIEAAEFDRPKFPRSPTSTERIGTIEEQFKASLSRHVSSNAVSRAASVHSVVTSVAPSSDQNLARTKPIQISQRMTSPPPTSSILENDAENTDGAVKQSSWNIDQDETFKENSHSRRNASLERQFISRQTKPRHSEEWLPWLLPVQPTHSPPHEPALFASWRHLFANATSQSYIRWKTISAPAALPLTTDECPTEEILHSDLYRQSPHSITTEEIEEGHDQALALLKLVHTRLSRGFQICVDARARHLAGSANFNVNIFSVQTEAHSSNAVVMMRGNTVHVLLSDAVGLTITKYHRLYSWQGPEKIRYEPQISTLLEEDYNKRVFLISSYEEENWSAIDNHLLHPSISPSRGLWTTSRARWALIPIDVPVQRRGMAPAEDTDEEIRLEGIRKLTILWQRVRYFPLNGRDPTTNVSRNAELSPLAIEYATTDPSVYLSNNLDNSPLLVGNQTVTSAKLSDGHEMYKTTSYDLQKLARDLQGPKGIKMRDRRWHLKSHRFCFEGVELVSFLVANFENLSTREDAVEFGNVLMNSKHLFQHVQLKHRFRDGNFFYTLSPEFRLPSKESRGWFGTRRGNVSSPAVTAVDQPKSFFSPALRAVGDSMSPKSPETPRILLSAAIKYDVDPRRKSDRSEMITLHYDRLHNPANAFHIMAEWENVTSKLIEEAVSNWSAMIERYGLRMVQLPMQEIGAIAHANPFRTPYVIKIATLPSYLQEASHEESQGTIPFSSPHERYAHCKAILRKKDYILDYEASSRFPANVNVSYTWGDRAGYSKDQYVHRNGTILIQIVDDETFILLANRLVSSRNAPRKREVRPGTALSRAHTSRSPLSSPMLRPFQEAISPTSAAERKREKTLMELKEDFEEFCANKEALAVLYSEMTRSHVAQTPSQKALRTPSLDASIPSLNLAPNHDVEPLSLEESLSLDSVLEAPDNRPID